MRDPRLVSTARRAVDSPLWLIGGFKLIEGTALLLLALGAHHLLHTDIADFVARWAAHLRLDLANHFVDRALSMLLSLDERHLKAISAGTFCYAALHFAEGGGLMLRKRWAEYLTVIATGSLIPLEAYELLRHLTLTRLILLAINVAVIWYLVAVLRHRGGRGD